jgi:hypothetical protein
MNRAETGLTPSALWREMEHWGYHLLPKRHPTSPGYMGLLVAMRDSPTRRHYDPETMKLRLASGQDTVKLVTLRRNDQPVESLRVCPGQVTLADRISKEVNFFSFGGRLDASPVLNETIYVLTSPGPVLDLNNGLGSISDQLFSETRGLLARWAAAWESDEGFYRRLVQTDPLQLYLACLQNLLERYHCCPALRYTWSAFYAALRREHAWLVQAGYYFDHRPSLEELLGPGR